MSSIGDTCVSDATGPSPDGARHVGPTSQSGLGPIFEDRSHRFKAEETFMPDDLVVQRMAVRLGRRPRRQRGRV